MTVWRLPVALLLTGLFGLFGLAGCTAQQPIPLYQLDSGNPGVPQQAQGLAVLLGPVSIADYLQREAFLQRQADGSLMPAENARWAGSLAADIEQLLLRQLAAKLDSQRLVLAPANPGFSPEVQVLLSISRLDSGPRHPAVLEAQWRLLDKAGKLRDSRLLRLEETHDGSPAEQVQAQSRLLRQLVRQLSEAIEPLRNQPAQQARPAPAPQPQAKPKQQPNTPTLGPTRDNHEVLRF